MVIIDFDDFHDEDGRRRAHHWLTSGTGQREEVRLLSVRPASITEADVAFPPSNVMMFDGTPSETNIHATFLYHGGPMPSPEERLRADPTDFIVDSGTSQILIDGSLATRAGIHTFLGHGIAHELSLGDVHLHDVAVQTTGLPLRQYGAEAIFGYELFGNRVVHIDYRHSQLDVLDKVPPLAPLKAWPG